MSIANNLKPKIRITPLMVAAVVAASGLVGLIAMPKAEAATNFTFASVRLDHLTGVTPTTGRVCAKTGTTATEAKVIVNFPTTAATNFAVSGTLANWTVDTTNLDTGQTAWPGIGTATNVTGQAVTFPSGDLATATLYCFNWNNTAALTTSSAGAAPSVFGYVKTQTSAPADIDQNYWGVDIISGETVTVNAIVAPYFTMGLSSTTDTFATNLSTAAVNTSNGARTVNVDTNALKGWIVWVKDANFKTVTDSGSSPANRHGALTSATAGGYAISNNTTNSLGTASATLTPGAENYGLGTTVFAPGTGAGTITLDPAYDGTAVKAGVLDQTKYRPIAASNGTAAGAQLSIVMRATISTSTPPGTDYQDILTYVGAGQF